MDSHSFCRRMLREALIELRETGYPMEKVAKAWVWSGDRRDWEFHGPDGEFFHGLKMTDCSWSAKAAGWLKVAEARRAACAADAQGT